MGEFSQAVVCGGNCCPYSCSCGQYCVTTCYAGTMVCTNTGTVIVNVTKVPLLTPAINSARAAKSPDGCSDNPPDTSINKVPFKWMGATGLKDYTKLPADVEYKINDCRCNASC